MTITPFTLPAGCGRSLPARSPLYPTTRTHQVQNDRDNCVDTELTLVQQAGPPSGAVDVDFQQALLSISPSI